MSDVWEKTELWIPGVCFAPIVNVPIIPSHALIYSVKGMERKKTMFYNVSRRTQTVAWPSLLLWWPWDLLPALAWLHMWDTCFLHFVFVNHKLSKEITPSCSLFSYVCNIWLQMNDVGREVHLLHSVDGVWRERAFVRGRVCFHAEMCSVYFFYLTFCLTR